MLLASVAWLVWLTQADAKPKLSEILAEAKGKLSNLDERFEVKEGFLNVNVNPVVTYVHIEDAKITDPSQNENVGTITYSTRTQFAMLDATMRPAVEVKQTARSDFSIAAPAKNYELEPASYSKSVKAALERLLQKAVARLKKNNPS